MESQARQQFVLDDSRLEILYLGLESVKYHPSAKSILSKPENKTYLPDEVYDHFFLLELLESEVDYLFAVYSLSHSSLVFQDEHKQTAFLLLKNNLKRGRAKKDEN